jgi:hypothetical protein
MNTNYKQHLESYLERNPEKIENLRTGTTFQQEMKKLDLYLEMWLSFLPPNAPKETVEGSKQMFKAILKNRSPKDISNSSIQLFLETRF